MKKNLSAILLAALLILPSFGQASFNSSTAQAYLSSAAKNPWTALALSSLSVPISATDYFKNIPESSALDLEAPILAITASGNDPQNFNGNNYVNKLKNFASENQLGDPTLINDDAFGILALTSAGFSPADNTITLSKTFLLNHQNQDGGWGYSLSSGSDTNDTSSVILALLSAGVSPSDSAVQNAINFLKTAQNSDGGFTYDPKSSFGTASDSSSTAWVMWALNALNQSPDSWLKDDNNPKKYLEANQTPDGYFKSDAQETSSTSFTPIVTAYSVIALTGKTLPIKISSSPSGGEQGESAFTFRIEGSAETVCEGKTQGPTALDVVKNASTACGFSYHIKDTSFGPYLDKINNDEASGSSGWQYAVNLTPPDVGAADYQLKNGDEVLWYFGDFNLKLTRLSLNALDISSGSSVIAKSESQEGSGWQALSGASVALGSQNLNTDQTGTVTLTPPDGYYKIFAQKDGYVRTNKALLKVGTPSTGAVDLSANVVAGQVQGASISFTVNPTSLDFGQLKAGATGQKTLTLKNSGSSDLVVAASVSGDGLFTGGLSFDNKQWQNFSSPVLRGQDKTIDASLTVPSGTSVGNKQGKLIIWATVK